MLLTVLRTWWDDCCQDSYIKYWCFKTSKIATIEIAAHPSNDEWINELIKFLSTKVGDRIFWIKKFDLKPH